MPFACKEARIFIPQFFDSHLIHGILFATTATVQIYQDLELFIIRQLLLVVIMER